MANPVSRADWEKRLEEIKTEKANLAEEFEGARFDQETKDRYNLLRDEQAEVEATITELQIREQDLLRDAGEGSARSEEGATFYVQKAGAVKNNEDIWDLSGMRMESPEQYGRVIRDKAMFALEGARFAHPALDQDHARSHVEHVMGDPENASYIGGFDQHSIRIAERIIKTGAPGYRSAFHKYLAGAPRSSEEEGYLYRAMSLTGASGGVAVPFVLDPTLLPSYNGAVNPFRNLADVRSITVDEWRGVTSGGITAAYAAELAATTDQSPTLASVSISTEMARVNIPHSIEIAMDWSTFASDMAQEIQNSKDVLEATQFATGTGTNAPFGVVTGATTLFTSSDSAALFAADLYGWHDALPPLYRSRAAFAMNNSTLSRIRQLDTAGGSAMLTPNLQVRSAANVGTTSAPDMQDSRANVDLFGKPVHEASGIAVFADNALIGVFGAFNPYFKIIDRVGLSIVDAGYAQDATTGMPTGGKFLLAYWRNGSKVIHANAFRTLRVA